MQTLVYTLYYSLSLCVCLSPPSLSFSSPARYVNCYNTVFLIWYWLSTTSKHICLQRYMTPRISRVCLFCVLLVYYFLLCLSVVLSVFILSLCILLLCTVFLIWQQFCTNYQTHIPPWYMTPEISHVGCFYVVY